jgi:hypothetical protein
MNNVLYNMVMFKNCMFYIQLCRAVISYQYCIIMSFNSFHELMLNWSTLKCNICVTSDNIQCCVAVHLDATS